MVACESLAWIVLPIQDCGIRQDYRLFEILWVNSGLEFCDLVLVIGNLILMSEDFATTSVQAMIKLYIVTIPIRFLKSCM